MKKILCFGDSNTFGYNPATGGRYNSDERWSAVLKNMLKDKYEVIECGCNNRTCFSDNRDGLEQTGYKALPLYFSKDIDILIVALGINDLQKFYSVSADDIQNGIENFIKIARNINPYAEIILASPSRIKSNILDGGFSFQFSGDSIEKSCLMCSIYKNAAEKLSCKFVDLDKTASVSDTDGLHYDAAEHKKIAGAFCSLLLSLPDDVGI